MKSFKKSEKKMKRFFVLLVKLIIFKLKKLLIREKPTGNMIRIVSEVTISFVSMLIKFLV